MQENRFTKIEVKILKSLYPTLGPKFLLPQLPRHTLSSIRDKANNLELYFDKHSWTKREDSLLKQLYPTVSMKQLQKVLPNRPRGSITNRAYKLNVQKASDYFKNMNPTSPHLTKNQRGYWAGFFDGEGHIGIQVSKGKKYDGMSYSLRVGASNTIEQVIKELQELFGGSIYINYINRRKPVFQWKVNSWRAFNFLSVVYPLLKIKKERAYLGIQFQKVTGFRRGKLTQVEIAQRKLLGQKLKLLNKRGR